MDKPIILAFEHSDGIHISPPIWPNHTLKIQPGDLTKFVPYGNGVYGYQGRDGKNPFLCGPTQEANGGIIFFSDAITKENFIALMKIFEIQKDWITNPDTQYAVFTTSSQNPGQDGYLSQMRLISRFGLRFMFGAINDAEYENYPKQSMTMTEILWLFIEREIKYWGPSQKELIGLFGGDGDFAREALSFGFMVENNYHGVYRIWSRAWLVTK